MNPDVDPKTHPYISTGLKESKFGVAFDDAPRAVPARRGAAAHRRARHRHAHRLADHRARAASRGGRARCSTLVDRARAPTASRSSTSTSAAASASAIATRRRCDPADYARGDRARCCGKRAAQAAVRARPPAGRQCRRAADPRALPEAGRGAQFRDRRRGDERPAAPGALRRLARGRAGASARRRRPPSGRSSDRSARARDFLAHDRELALAEGDLLAIRSAGAYAMAMSSNYNSRPRAAEVIVDGETRASRASARDRGGTLRARNLASLSRSRRAQLANRCDVRNRNTDVSASPESAIKSCISKKMWLEFRQQVAMGLSRGRSKSRRPIPATPATK